MHTDRNVKAIANTFPKHFPKLPSVNAGASLVFWVCSIFLQISEEKHVKSHWLSHIYDQDGRHLLNKTVTHSNQGLNSIYTSKIILTLKCSLVLVFVVCVGFFLIFTIIWKYFINWNRPKPDFRKIVKSTHKWYLHLLCFMRTASKEWFSIPLFIQTS